MDNEKEILDFDLNDIVQQLQQVPQEDAESTGQIPDVLEDTSQFYEQVDSDALEQVDSDAL